MQTGGILAVVLLAACCGGADRNSTGTITPGVGASEPAGASGPNAPRSAAAAPHARAELEQRIATLTVGITLQPRQNGSSDGPATLRSVQLSVPMQREEAHALWSDGTPVSANERITVDIARVLLDSIERWAFFDAAVLTHSARTQSPSSPPPANSQAGLAQENAAPHIRIAVGVHDDDWYRYYTRDWPVGPDARRVLEAVRGSLTGRAALLVDGLVAQLPPRRQP